MADTPAPPTPVAPAPQNGLDASVSDGDRAVVGAAIMQMLLKTIGEDMNRGRLRETPIRAWKAWQFWTSGYDQNPRDVLKTFSDGAENFNELVFQGSISFWSCCEHHLAPFFGVAHIGYIPNGKVVGLSKLSRLLDIFARRLTMQERITTQVANALLENLDALGVGVVLQARHSCMESRGVCKAGTITMTSALLGGMKHDAKARSEFMAMVAAASGGLKSL